MKKQNNLEKLVSNYIQKNLSFILIGIPDKKSRLFYESKLISTVSLCDECYASNDWLGNHSPKEKIVKSGLWLVNELYKEPFSETELDIFIAKYIRK